MNTDIRLSITFKNNRKRLKLQKRLGKEAVLALIDFWIEVALSYPTGELKGVDEEDIAIMAGWEGDPHEFVQALLDIGFLHKEGDTYIVHEWEEHQPWASKEPERRADRSKGGKKRWEGVPKEVRTLTMKILALTRWHPEKVQELLAKLDDNKEDMRAGCELDASSMRAESELNAGYPNPIPNPNQYPNQNQSNNENIAYTKQENVNDKKRGEEEKEKKDLIPLTGYLSETCVSDLSVSEQNTPCETEQKENHEPLKEEESKTEGSEETLALSVVVSEKSKGNNKRAGRRIEKTNSKVPPCPYDEIVKLFNEKLPELPRVRKLSERRKKLLRARWREIFTDEAIATAYLQGLPKTVDDGLYWFSKYFEHVNESDFLMGRIDHRDRVWRADFEWLIRPENFLKVLEGKYHQKGDGLYLSASSRRTLRAIQKVLGGGSDVDGKGEADFWKTYLCPQ